LSSLWGNQRMGSRIESAISQAVDHLCRSRSVVEADEFLFTPEQQANGPRNREGTKLANLRKPEFLPPQEIRTAIEYSITKHAGLFHDELAEAVARLFGFKTTTAKLRERIESVTQGLVNDGVIELRDGRVQYLRM